MTSIVATREEGWVGQVAQLQAALDEGHGIVTKVIGPADVASEDKDADCAAVQLSQNLGRAIGTAVQLIEQLHRIHEQF